MQEVLGLPICFKTLSPSVVTDYPHTSVQKYEVLCSTPDGTIVFATFIDPHINAVVHTHGGIHILSVLFMVVPFVGLGDNM